jgi:transposase InsO family protein
VATTWRVLSRRGFVIPQPHKRPRSSGRRFPAELPNELWQADLTHWPLADGTDVEILDIIDDHSRLLIGSIARPVFTAADIVTDLHAAIARHGRPERMLADNGAVFTGHYRGRGWVAFERELAALGIALSHSTPYHRQPCGKVERLHQTIKKWLATRPPAGTTADLHHRLDTFVDSTPVIGPIAASADAPRLPPGRPTHAGPTRQGIRIDEQFRVRTDRIDRDGKLTLRHNSQPHHIGVGPAWAGTEVLPLVHELNVRIITADTGDPVRDLTIDPTRDYQPHAATV